MLYTNCKYSKYKQKSPSLHGYGFPLLEEYKDLIHTFVFHSKYLAELFFTNTIVLDITEYVLLRNWRWQRSYEINCQLYYFLIEHSNCLDILYIIFFFFWYKNYLFLTYGKIWYLLASELHVCFSTKHWWLYCQIKQLHICHELSGTPLFSSQVQHLSNLIQHLHTQCCLFYN